MLQLKISHSLKNVFLKGAVGALENPVISLQGSSLCLPLLPTLLPLFCCLQRNRRNRRGVCVCITARERNFKELAHVIAEV